MDAAGVISVGRTLPIDGALLDDVMLRLRRDSVTPALCWTLGKLGGAEVDARFTSTGPSWTTEARLWNHAGRAVTAATLHLEATGADEVRLTLEPVIPAARARDFQKWELLDLAQAAVDELAEELLWHATRAGVAHRS
jgi:hypothetical protein